MKNCEAAWSDYNSALRINPALPAAGALKFSKIEVMKNGKAQ